MKLSLITEDALRFYKGISEYSGLKNPQEAVKIIANIITEDPDHFRDMRHIIEDNSYDEYFESEFDPIAGIIEGAAEVGIELSSDDVALALTQTGLDADQVSLNQPVINGSAVSSGHYIVFKGGTDKVIGWVTDDRSLAEQYGEVFSRVFDYAGQQVHSWSVVHDWDGYLQLVPPGPAFRKVYDNGYLLLV